MDDSCELDALLDVLDEDDMEDIPDALQPEKEKNTEASPSDEAEEDDESEIQRQLEAMEAKMREMKEKLKRKSGKLGEKATETVTERSQDEIDIFSHPGSNITDCRSLKSPVKTQPLKEAEREKKAIKYVPKTSNWCPSLIREDKTRIIQGEEAASLREKLDLADRKRKEEIARKDLQDSSDEERDEEGNSIYNDCGRELKKRLAHHQSANFRPEEETSEPLAHSVSQNCNRANPVNNAAIAGKPEKKAMFEKLMVEKFSGLRVARPVVSQSDIDQAMRGRKMIQMHRLKESIVRKETEGDWITLGVLYFKSPHKSNSGNEFSVWKLSDLKGEIKTISLLLFGRAHKEHWKTSLNKVVGILNPKVMEDRHHKGEVSLSIDHPDKLLVVGDSFDIAKCGFKKQDGSNCTNIVNKNVCEFCVFHLKKAYANASGKRNALQSSFSATNPDASRARLMQKIAPRSQGEIFAGGKILNDGPMVVGKKSAKQKMKDNAMLAGLGPSGARISSVLEDDKPNLSSSKKQPSKIGAAGNLLSDDQKKVVRAISSNVSEELGSRLLAPTPGARAILNTYTKEQRREKELESKKQEKSAKDLLSEHTRAVARANRPVLGWGSAKAGDIVLDISPAQKSRTGISHSRALAILQAKNKKIVKEDPNSGFKSKLKTNTPEFKAKVQKRLASEDDEELENDSKYSNKKPKIETPERKRKTITVLGKEMSLEEYERLKNKKSKNSHLVAEAELDATDKYFNYMEKKDEMEEKMLGTFEIKTKAVTCHVCNYTDFKASDLCKEQGHRYKVIDAVKRFFSCKNCKKRVTSLSRLPQEACKQCGGANWVRAGMMAERKGPKLDNEVLSIRGNEETFVGSVVNANINL